MNWMALVHYRVDGYPERKMRICVAGANPDDALATVQSRLNWFTQGWGKVTRVAKLVRL